MSLFELPTELLEKILMDFCADNAFFINKLTHTIFTENYKKYNVDLLKHELEDDEMMEYARTKINILNTVREGSFGRMKFIIKLFQKLCCEKYDATDVNKNVDHHEIAKYKSRLFCYQKLFVCCGTYINDFMLEDLRISIIKNIIASNDCDKIYHLMIVIENDENHFIQTEFTNENMIVSFEADNHITQNIDHLLNICENKLNLINFNILSDVITQLHPINVSGKLCVNNLKLWCRLTFLAITKIKLPKLIYHYFDNILEQFRELPVLPIDKSRTREILVQFSTNKAHRTDYVKKYNNIGKIYVTYDRHDKEKCISEIETCIAT